MDQVKTLPDDTKCVVVCWGRISGQSKFSKAILYKQEIIYENYIISLIGLGLSFLMVFGFYVWHGFLILL